MRLKRVLGMRSTVGAAVLGLALLPLALGAGGNSGALAAGASYPLFGPSSPSSSLTYGTVQFAGRNGDASQLTVSLQRAAANSTYVVSECQNKLDATMTCINSQATQAANVTYSQSGGYYYPPAGATSGTTTGQTFITTDSSGNAYAALSFPSNTLSVDNIYVVNAGNSGDYYTAATSANAYTQPSNGYAAPSMGSFIGASGTLTYPGLFPIGVGITR